MKKEGKEITNYYSRYITRNGKKLGPYYYSNKKVNGKVISTYLGTTEPRLNIKPNNPHNSNIRFNKKYIIFALSLISVILLLYVAYNLNLFSTGNIPINTLGGEGESINFTNETNTTNSGDQVDIIPEVTDSNIETTQVSAAIGEPVKWQKEVSLESPGPAVVEIPLESENIEVYKLDNEDQNQDPVPDSQISITAKATSEIDLNNQDKNTDSQKSKLPILDLFKKIFNFITGKAITIQENQEVKEIVIDENSQNYLIQYETPAPTMTEEKTENGKILIVSSPESIDYNDIYVSTSIDESLKPNYDSLEILSDTGDNIDYSLSDSNEDGINDRLEFTAPEAGTYTIIVVIRALHLDENRNEISDIFEQVKEKDDVWSEEIQSAEYVRVTFEKNLTSENDITIYPRFIKGTPRIEVYEKDSAEKIAEFTNLNQNEYNKIFLTNLVGSQDTFDLRIWNGSLQFDHIIDPYINVTSSTFWFSKLGTSPLTVHSSTWFAESGSEYLIMVFGEARQSSTGADTRVSIRQNGVEQFYIADRPGVGTMEIMPFSAMQVYSGTGADVTYDIQISSSSSSTTAGARNMRIIALRIDNMTNPNYNYSYNTNEQANVDNVWGDDTGDTDEVRITPSTPGYYLIFAGASVSSGNTGSSASWRVNIDNGAEYIPYLQGAESTWSYARIEDRATTERVNMNFVGVRLFTAAQHSIKMQFADIDTTASADWRDRSIVVMRLSDNMNFWSSSNIPQVSTTSQTFQNNANWPQPASNGIYVILGSQAIRGSVTNGDFEQQIAVDGVSYGLRAWRPKDTNDYPFEAYIANYTVTSGIHTSSMQYRRQDNQGTAYTKNSEIVILKIADIPNSPPQIPYIENIGSVNPLEGSIKTVNVEVHVSDLDGVSDIQNVNMGVNKSATTKTGICTFNNNIDANTANYSCSVDIQYYDDSGIWTINVSALDNANAYVESLSSFTYTFLNAIIKTNPIGDLTWPIISQGSTDQFASNNPVTIENTGNYEGPIKITAYDLSGEGNSLEKFSAANFVADPLQDVDCRGTTLSNSTEIIIANTNLLKGLNSREDIYFCISSVPQVSSQTYSAKGDNAWIIQIQ